MCALNTSTCAINSLCRQNGKKKMWQFRLAKILIHSQKQTQFYLLSVFRTTTCAAPRQTVTLFSSCIKILFKWLFVLWLFFLAATRLIYVRVNSMWCVVKWNKSCENEIIANYICTSKYEYSKFKWSVRWCRQDSSRLCGSRLIITSSLESSNDPLASSTQYSSFTMF